MRRWAVLLGCALWLGAGLGCSSSSGDGDGSAGSGAGASGAGAGDGAAGHAGSSGASGSGTGGTSGGAGSAGMNGASGAGASDAGGMGGGTEPRACGGRGLGECPPNGYCDFPPEADCGRADAPGTCREILDVACPELYAPVCGCDGETYSSACHARQAAKSIDYEGECGAEPPPATYDCVATGALCFIAPPACGDGKVPSIDGMCFGPCVPIEQCACEAAEQCPEPERYTCHLSAGRCGPYTM